MSSEESSASANATKLAPSTSTSGIDDRGNSSGPTPNKKITTTSVTCRVSDTDSGENLSPQTRRRKVQLKKSSPVSKKLELSISEFCHHVKIQHKDKDPDLVKLKRYKACYDESIEALELHRSELNKSILVRQLKKGKGERTYSRSELQHRANGVRIALSGNYKTIPQTHMEFFMDSTVIRVWDEQDDINWPSTPESLLDKATAKVAEIMTKVCEKFLEKQQQQQ